MGLFDNFRNRRREGSSHVAKERLMTVLVHDRVKLTPDDMDKMKQEIIEVISRYVEVSNLEDIEVVLTRDDNAEHLKADIPLRRTRQV